MNSDIALDQYRHCNKWLWYYLNFWWEGKALLRIVGYFFRKPRLLKQNKFTNLLLLI